VVKAFAGEKRSVDKFSKYNREWYRVDTASARITQVFPQIINFAMACGSLLIWAVGGRWAIFGVVWGVSALGVTLTAIDLKKYTVLSMVCYLCMGWAILPFLGLARRVLTEPGFLLLLWGGIAYTLGAVLYGIGSKKRWFHSVFHIFVVLGSLLQMICIVFYVM
jgi:hemolysin III